MRWLCLFAVSALLSGCAAPAAFTVASLAMDSGSYMMSGKTVTDHGLSLAMDKDCSMTRVLDEDDEICEEEQDYEVVHGTLRPLPIDINLDADIDLGDTTLDRVAYEQLAQRVHNARTIQAN